MDLPQKTNQIQARFKWLGVSNVYFEPPKNLQLIYPCVIFKRGADSHRSCDNRIYKLDNAYDITYVSYEPDDQMANVILVGDLTHEPPFKMIRKIRHYVAEGLHHDQYKLYY